MFGLVGYIFGCEMKKVALFAHLPQQNVEGGIFNGLDCYHGK